MSAPVGLLPLCHPRLVAAGHMGFLRPHRCPATPRPYHNWPAPMPMHRCPDNRVHVYLVMLIMKHKSSRLHAPLDLTFDTKLFGILSAAATGVPLLDIVSGFTVVQTVPCGAVGHAGPVQFADLASLVHSPTTWNCQNNDQYLCQARIRVSLEK